MSSIVLTASVLQGGGNGQKDPDWKERCGAILKTVKELEQKGYTFEGADASVSIITFCSLSRSFVSEATISKFCVRSFVSETLSEKGCVLYESVPSAHHVQNCIIGENRCILFTTSNALSHNTIYLSANFHAHCPGAAALVVSS